jgi:hypothetical protein
MIATATCLIRKINLKTITTVQTLYSRGSNRIYYFMYFVFHFFLTNNLKDTRLRAAPK